VRRRDFLWTLPAAAPVTTVAARLPFRTILVHEHVMVDFRGADQPHPGPYDPDVVFNIAKPKLDEIYKLGCRRFQDATPNFIGRNPKLLRRLADATGLDIWTNTGLYAARDHQFLPAYARTESAEEIARRWINETRRGIDSEKPRFIKVGVNRAPLDDLDRKIVQAAAICSKETGLTFASHTAGGGLAAVEQLDIVVAAKCDPGRFVWVHAHNEKDHSFHEKIARAGAWVEFDGIGPKSLDWHVACVRHMASRGLLSRVLVSQDAGYYRVGEPGGGNFRPYALIYTEFLPKLDIETARILMVANPVHAYGGSAPA